MVEKKTSVKCPLCNLQFEDGEMGNVLDGKFYHPECMKLHEKLTNAKGQLGNESMMNRFKAAQQNKKQKEEKVSSGHMGEEVGQSA